MVKHLIIGLTLILAACAQPQKPVEVELPFEHETPVVVTPPPTYTPAPNRMVLSWENTTEPHPERRPWSDTLVKTIGERFDFGRMPDDIETFCPKFDLLSAENKIRAVAELIIAVTYYESGYSPTSRMQETTMGTDPVTGKPVFSEGLLQLSYQDIQWAPWCEFDWAKDKLLSPTDPNKTILDPHRNLRCGVRIMANQAHARGFTTTKNYWAVLKSGGKYQKISEIATRVKNKARGCL